LLNIVDRELSIIFATKTDNSITQKMAKLLIIENDNFRYIYVTFTLRYVTLRYIYVPLNVQQNKWRQTG
jgi:hypothetical protein